MSMLYSTVRRFWRSRYLVPIISLLPFLGVFAFVSLGANSNEFTQAMSGEDLTNVAPFTDVPATDWGYTSIQALYRRGITVGCLENPLKYCPDAPVTRWQMALFLLRSKGITPKTYTIHSFSDVPPISPWFHAVEELYAQGLTMGCYYNEYSGERRFCPDQNVTRAEIAAFLLRSKGIHECLGCSSSFTDVDTLDWSFPWIEKLVRMGITRGCFTDPLSEKMKYCPASNVTRREMAVFLIRTFFPSTFTTDNGDESDSQNNNSGLPVISGETFTPAQTLWYSGNYACTNESTSLSVKADITAESSVQVVAEYYYQQSNGWKGPTYFIEMNHNSNGMHEGIIPTSPNARTDLAGGNGTTTITIVATDASLQISRSLPKTISVSACISSGGGGGGGGGGGVDRTGPVISALQSSAAKIYYGTCTSQTTATQVSATITDSSGVSAATLSYRYVHANTNGNWQMTNMNRNGNLYPATLDTVSSDTSLLDPYNGDVEFSLTAIDTLQNSTTRTGLTLPVMHCNEDNIHVGAWFYDGWHSKTPELSAECEDKTDSMQWVFDATPREIDYVYNRQMQSLRNYEYEGIIAYLPQSALNTLPLYRFQWNGRHRYTTSESQKDEFIAQGAVLEGILGYVYSTRVTGTKPLFAPVFMGDTQQLTLDNIRAWNLLQTDAAASIVGYAYETAQTDTTVLHGYVKMQPGQELPRTPLLGRVHSDDQEVMDQYIEWASDSGIDFFAFEFFWAPRPECPNQTIKQKALDNAFLMSSSSHDLDFALGWFPVQDYSKQQIADAFDFMFDHYFFHPRYLLIDNKPVVYAVVGGLTMHGVTIADMTEIIAEKRLKAQQLGFDGLYIINIEAGNPYGPIFDAGMDGSTRFTYNDKVPNWLESDTIAEKSGVVTFQEYTEAYVNAWTEHAQQLALINSELNYVPVVGAGWDRSVVPWLRYRSHIATHNSPEIWKEELLQARDFVETNVTSNPKLVMLTAWNEWSEGQIIEPDSIWGTAYIDAIRDVFWGR